MIHLPHELFLKKLSTLSLPLQPGQHVVFFDLNCHIMSVFRWHNLSFSIQFTAPFSSSKHGISNIENSLGTPIGIHIICEKIGQEVPLNGEFIGRKFTGQVIPQANDANQKAHILTRILRLKGCEPGINLDYDDHQRCCDTYKRCVYIHGTNLEAFIPAPLSHGCLLLKNQDLIRLYNDITLGDFCWIWDGKA